MKTKNLKLKINSKSRGFALLYAMLLMLLISLTIAAITTSTLSDLARMRKSREVTKLYQIANTGIEKGIVTWKDSDAAGRTTHCGAGDIVLKINNIDDTEGVAKVNMCDNADGRYIVSNAYYKKSRIRFRADVDAATNKFTIYQIGF